MNIRKINLFMVFVLVLSSFIFAEPFYENISVQSGWNTFKFPILPVENSRENVLNSIDGKYKLIKTIDNGIGYTWADFYPASVNNLDYINFSLPYSIYMKESGLIELVGFPDPNIPYLLNTSFGDWYNISECLSTDQKKTQRDKVEYDYNGLVENKTYSEFSFIECDYCIPSSKNGTWSSWYNISSCKPDDLQLQEQNMSTYDVNDCFTKTNLDSDLFIPSTFYNYKNISCDYCTPDLVNTSWSSWSNISSCYANSTLDQQRTRIEYDQNTCGEVSNKTYYDYRYVDCNYELNIEVCDSGCDYTSVGNAIDDLYCYNQTTNVFNFDGCTKLTAPLNIFVHDGERSRFFLENISNITIVGESKEGVVINGDVLYSNIALINVDNITIKNYTLNYGYNGIWIEESSNIVIENVDSFSSDLRGMVLLKNSDNNVIRNSVVANVNHSGFLLYGGSDNNIFNNVTSYNCNNSGLYFLEDNRNNSVINSEFFGNAFEGLHFADGSQNIKIENVISHNNSDNGILIVSANNTIITNSIFENNSWNGLSIENSEGVSILNSSSLNNALTGMEIENSNYVFIKNLSSVSNKDGFNLLNSSLVELNNSHIEKNKFDGFYLDSNCKDVALINNSFYLNYNGVFYYTYFGDKNDIIVRENNFFANKYCDFDYLDNGCNFDYTNPGPIINFTAIPHTTNNQIILKWISSGDNYIDGENYGSTTLGDKNENYILKYSTSPINDSNWDSATIYSQTWNPLNSDESESKVIALPTNDLYWFAIKAVDDAGLSTGISYSEPVFSPLWQVYLTSAECRNKRNGWGCNETDGASSPTTNYWYDTITWNVSVINTGNMPQTRPTFSYTKEDGVWSTNPSSNFTITPNNVGLTTTFYGAGEYCVNKTAVDVGLLSDPDCLDVTVAGHSDCLDTAKLNDSCSDELDIMRLGNIDSLLDFKLEGYHQAAVSIKDVDPGGCYFQAPGVECTYRANDPFGSKNYKSYSMREHLFLNKSEWTTVIPIEEGNNTANSPFDVDLIFCNTNVVYYNRVPFNFTINTTYPWEAIDTFCGSSKGYGYDEGVNPLQNNSGWYHMTSNTCDDDSQYCYWRIKGLPPGTYNFSITTGYYDEDRPDPISWEARFI